MSRQVTMQFGKPSAAANQGGGSSGGKLALLWENPSPSSDYSGGTLSIDLSGYDCIVVTSGYTGTSPVFNASAFKGETTRISAVVHASTNNNLIVRPYDVSDSSIVIGNCTLYTQGQSSGADRPGYLKPIKIYGIKFG